MAIHFSIARRGLLPTEETQQDTNQTLRPAGLRPQLQCPQTVDAVKFQKSSSRLPSVLPEGELLAALSMMERVMLHEMEKGNAVTLPGIGTFRLALKGNIEVRNGEYHGKDVRVDGIRFQPDRELLRKARSLEVDQVPYRQTIETEETDVEARLAELFASKDVVSHKDVAAAFGQTLTRGRVSSLLWRLTQQGRIVREGKGAQTRYRLAKQ